MQWQGRRGSQNIEDRRRMSTGRAGSIGGVGLIAVLLIGYFLGIDVTPLSERWRAAGRRRTDPEQCGVDRGRSEGCGVRVGDAGRYGKGLGRHFSEGLGADLRADDAGAVQGRTQSACGGASGATGPFYCPNDKKVYLDTDFFVTMSQRMGASGDFAAAYVVAHEVGHHVQDELGILGKVTAARAQASQADSNALSVRVELQADCFSGVWARAAGDKLGTLEQGDIAEAMDAASRIGDDTLQANAGQRPMPDSFTHGTSEQRQRWFAAGYESGSIESCDTFSTDNI